MTWSVNECISLLCEGMCVVLVVVGVYVKDRWSLSGVVPPLLLFSFFYSSIFALSPLQESYLIHFLAPCWPPPTLLPHHPLSRISNSDPLSSSLFCLSEVSSAFFSSCFADEDFCVWLPFWSLLTWHVGLWSYLRFVKESRRWTRWQPWALDVSDCALWIRFSSHFSGDSLTAFLLF